MYCAFRLNPEYDAELIEYLSHKKNKSRAIRELIRAGYTKATALDVRQPEEPQIIVREIVKQPEKSAPEQQKNQPEKLVWKL